MDWSTQFKNYIDNFTDINTFNLDVLKNNNIKYTDDIQVLYNIKLQTDWINSKNIFFGNNNYNNIVNKYIFFKNEYITNIFNLYFKDEFKYSNKINKIDFKKYKYFVKCNFDDNIEYIKFNPNFEKENIESILKKCKFKFLCVPWVIKSTKYYGNTGTTGSMGYTGASGYNNSNTGETGYNNSNSNTMGNTGATGYNNSNSNTMGNTGYNNSNSSIIIGLKIDSIIIEYNKNLMDYKSIKDIINIVCRNKKLDISDIIDDTEITIKLEFKFNKYKFKNKKKIENSNNKILDFIIQNSHSF